MADETRDANVRLTADVDPYRRDIALATQDTNKFAASLDSLSTKLDGITKRAGKKLMLFGGAGAAGIATVTHEAAQFEKRMATLNATTALTDKTMAGFRKNVEGLTKSLPISSSEAIALVTQLEKLGVTSHKSIGKISESLVKLSAASGEDLSGLTTQMVELGKQMGTLSAGSMAQYANSLLVVSKTSGVAASSVLSFSQAIAPAARAAQMSEQQVLGVSAAFAKAGADGYYAANTFNQMLNDITRQVATGAPEIAKYSNLIGVTADQFKKMDRATAITEIFEAINRQGPDAIKTLDRLGYDGVRAITSLQAVSQSGGLREAIAKATGAYSSTGALDDSSKKAMDNMTDSMTKTKNTMESMAVNAGGPFVAAFTPVVDVLNELLQVLNMLAAPLATIGAGLSFVLAAGAAALGGSMMLSKFKSMVNVAGYVAHSAPVGAIRGGMEVGRGIRAGTPVTNDYSRAYADRSMGYWNRPIYRAAVGAGEAMGAGGQGWLGRAAVLPIKAATVLTQAQAEFYRDARTPGLDRPATFMRGIPTAGGLAMGSMRAFAADPRGFLSGLHASTDPMTGVATSRRAQLAQSILNRGGTLPEATVTALNKEMGRATAQMAASAKATAVETTAKRQAAVATGALTKAFLTLQAQSVASAAANVGGLAKRGVMGLAGGALGLVGGPIGAGVLAAGVLGYGAYKKHKEFEAGAESDGTTGLDKINVALGGASTELMTFSNALKEATKALPKGQTMEDLSTISQQVINLARTPRRELNDETLKSYKTTAGRASYLQSQGITTPDQLQLYQADLVQEYGVGEAQKVTDKYLSKKGRGPDYESMFKDIAGQQGSGNVWDKLQYGLGFGGSGTAKEMIGEAFDTIERQGTIDAKEKNPLYANQRMQNSAVSVLAGATDPRLKGEAKKQTIGDAFRVYEDRLLDGKRLGVNAGTFGRDMERALGEDAGNARVRERYIGNFIKNRSGDRLEGMEGLASNTQLADLAKKEDSAYTTGLKNTGGIGQFALSSGTVQGALAQPGDVNQQFQATNALMAQATKLSTDFAGTDAELQKLKASIKDTNDPLYQMAVAAQQFNTMARQNAQVFMSRQERRTDLVRSHDEVLNEDPSAPDHQQRALDDRQAANAGIATDYERGKSIVMAHRNFAIQVARIDEDRYRATSRAEEDFNLSMEQSSADHQRQLERGARDFAIGMLQSTNDFHTSRARQERDFNKSMVRMAEDAAKGFYDPWRRVYSEYTTDVGTLLQNLADQNEKLGAQNSNLDKVSGMGLSAKSIETLGLADPKNAQQLERLVLDLINDPSMVAKINSKVATRIASSGDLAQSKFSTSFKRTKEDFAQGLADAESDFNKGQRRAKNAHGRMLADMATDWSIQMSRAADAHERMLKRMNQDNATQTKRALQDLARLNEEVTGSFESVMGQAAKQVRKNLGSLGNSTLKEIRRMNSAYASLMKTMGINGRGTGDPNSPRSAREAEGRVASQLAPQIGKAVQTLMEAYGYKAPTSAPGRHAAGGIATKMQAGYFGEAGPEALIPLGPRGHDFLAGVYKEISKSLVKDMGTIASPVSFKGGGGYVDASTNFNGPISVAATDPNQMARELQEKARIQKLTRPKQS